EQPEQPEQPEQLVDFPDLSFYQLFLQKLERSGKSVTIDELVEQWELPKTLVNTWLKQSIEEGVVKKLIKPIRYQFVNVSQLGLCLD
ncbi:MAG: DNA-processing protein DprA, partial [Pseudomonas sp.]